MEALVDFLSLLGAFGGSFVLGAAKKYTSVFDGTIGRAIKPVQPLLVAGAAMLLPRIGEALGIVSPDAAQFVSAPTATIIAVSAREGLRRLNDAINKRANL